MNPGDRILQLIQMKGPVIPVQIAKELGTNIIMASAHLSELSSAKKIKISHLKVGGSPLYYLPGQESRLANFADNLAGPEKNAMNLLKEKKVLRDRELSPLNRAALREIKDFAMPLQVSYQGGSEIFWKWHLLSNEETQILIKGHLSPEPEKKAVPEKKEIKPDNKPDEIKKPEIKREIIPEKKTEEEKTEKIKPEKEIKPEKKEVQKRIEPIESVFLDEIKSYFNKNKIEIIEENILRKDSDAEFIVKVPSAVGNLTYFCKARSKKKVNDGDLSSTFIKGQAKRLPILFLTKGDLTKKAQEQLEQEFKGMSVQKI